MGDSSNVRTVYATVLTSKTACSPRAIRFEGLTFADLRARLIATRLPGTSEDCYVEVKGKDGQFVCLLDQDVLPDGELTINVNVNTAGYQWRDPAQIAYGQPSPPYHGWPQPEDVPFFAHKHHGPRKHWDFDNFEEGDKSGGTGQGGGFGHPHGHKGSGYSSGGGHHGMRHGKHGHHGKDGYGHNHKGGQGSDSCERGRGHSPHGRHGSPGRLGGLGGWRKHWKADGPDRHSGDEEGRGYGRHGRHFGCGRGGGSGRRGEAMHDLHVRGSWGPGGGRFRHRGRSHSPPCRRSGRGFRPVFLEGLMPLFHGMNLDCDCKARQVAEDHPEQKAGGSSAEHDADYMYGPEHSGDETHGDDWQKVV